MKRLTMVAALLFAGVMTRAAGPAPSSATVQERSDSLAARPCLPPEAVGVGACTADPWLCSANAAALTRYASDGTGTAELSLTKGKGGFADFSDSPSALALDAYVASYFRLNRHAVVCGSMSYTNFSGRDMAGSAFIQHIASPSYSAGWHGACQGLAGAATGSASAPAPFASRHLPFDIVEDSLTNTGAKHQDTYRLAGGVGYDVWRGFSLGANMVYTAANMAKYKDLRHKNKLMDLDLTAGFYLPLTLGCGGARRLQLALGAHYLYHRTTESLRFSTYGKGDKVYNSLISYANFTGHVEQFGGDGYTDKSREMPLVSDYNGVGVQFSCVLARRPAPTRAGTGPAPTRAGTGPAPTFSFFNSFTYSRRSGYYGRHSPFTITYTGHSSELYQYTARLTAGSRGVAEVWVELSLSSENLRCDASNYRELQNEQDATYYEYYTPVKMSNKLWTDGRVSVTASLPRWTLCAGADWHRRRQTAYVYPFFRRQDLSGKGPFVSVSHDIVLPKCGVGGQFGSLAGHRRADAPMLTVALHFSFLKGSGEPCEDLTSQAPSDKQELPPSMDDYLLREYHWLTSAQYTAGGSVAYSFIFPKTRLRTFLRAAVSHRKANEESEYSLGRDHTTASLAVGCNF